MAERQFPYLPEGREPGVQSRRDARERSLSPREFLPEVEDVWIALDRAELRRGEAVTATVSGRPLGEGAEVGLVCGVVLLGRAGLGRHPEPREQAGCDLRRLPPRRPGADDVPCARGRRLLLRGHDAQLQLARGGRRVRRRGEARELRADLGDAVSHGLAIEFDGDGHVRPGDVLRGHIVVGKKKKSRGLAVRAAMSEQTKSEHWEVFSTEPQQIHEGNLEEGMRLPFALQVPTDALPSFICAYGRVYWA